MAFVVADRVQETTTTTGTGTVTLAGAVTGFQSFAAIGNGNTTFYSIAEQSGSDWEVGIGTYTSSGTTLSRDTILASSNSGSAVNFGAGTKNVFVTYPAERAAYGLTAGSGISITAGTGTTTIAASGSGGTGAFATYNYTGDGATTTFAATTDITVDNILVTENGILQEPTTDYTVSGTNVVFTTAPANGVEIQIRVLAGGGGGSSTVLESIRTISSNYTITEGYNGLSVGPITINTGISVTVGTDECWAIMNF